MTRNTKTALATFFLMLGIAPILKRFGLDSFDIAWTMGSLFIAGYLFIDLAKTAMPSKTDESSEK